MKLFRRLGRLIFLILFICIDSTVTACKGWSDLESEVNHGLEKLHEFKKENGDRMVFPPFVRIESLRSEKFIQFLINPTGTLDIQIAVSSIFIEDGKKVKEEFLEPRTVDRLKEYFKKWNLILNDDWEGGKNIEDGSDSGFRILNTELRIKRSEYGKFVTGLFSEAFEEKGELKLKVVFSEEPEGD